MNERMGGQWGEGLAVTEGAQHPGRMSDQPPRRGATYEDLEKLPPNVIGEVVAGELYVSPRPASRHAFATGVLHIELGGAFSQGKKGPGGWVILFEPELHL